MFHSLIRPFYLSFVNFFPFFFSQALARRLSDRNPLADGVSWSPGRGGQHFRSANTSACTLPFNCSFPAAAGDPRKVLAVCQFSAPFSFSQFHHFYNHRARIYLPPDLLASLVRRTALLTSANTVTRCKHVKAQKTGPGLPKGAPPDLHPRSGQLLEPPPGQFREGPAHQESRQPRENQISADFISQGNICRLQTSRRKNCRVLHMSKKGRRQIFRSLPARNARVN